jgi:hypothetical protein
MRIILSSKYIELIVISGYKYRSKMDGVHANLIDFVFFSLFTTQSLPKRLNLFFFFYRKSLPLPS